jgi:Co/Zn/Cd efflux system component
MVEREAAIQKASHQHTHKTAVNVCHLKHIRTNNALPLINKPENAPEDVTLPTVPIPQVPSSPGTLPIDSVSDLDYQKHISAQLPTDVELSPVENDEKLNILKEPQKDESAVYQCHDCEEEDHKDIRMKASQKKLLLAAGFCVFFMIAEAVGGYLSNSLAILTDATHLLSDVAGFLISIIAIWITSKRATGSMSFGFHRAEILGAIISVLLVWAITGYLMYEAVVRIENPQAINAPLMFGVAVLGLVVNMVMAAILHGGSHGHVKEIDDIEEEEDEEGEVTGVLEKEDMTDVNVDGVNHDNVVVGSSPREFNDGNSNAEIPLTFITESEIVPQPMESEVETSDINEDMDGKDEKEDDVSVSCSKNVVHSNMPFINRPKT